MRPIGPFQKMVCALLIGGVLLGHPGSDVEPAPPTRRADAIQGSRHDLAGLTRAMGGPGASDDLRLGHLTQEWLATSEYAEARTSSDYWHHQSRTQPAPAVHDQQFQAELLGALARFTGTPLSQHQPVESSWVKQAIIDSSTSFGDQCAFADATRTRPVARGVALKPRATYATPRHVLPAPRRSPSRACGREPETRPRPRPETYRCSRRYGPCLAPDGFSFLWYGSCLFPQRGRGRRGFAVGRGAANPFWARSTGAESAVQLLA